MLREHNIQGLDIDIEESVPISMPLRLLRQHAPTILEAVRQTGLTSGAPDKKATFKIQ